MRDKLNVTVGDHASPMTPETLTSQTRATNVRQFPTCVPSPGGRYYQKKLVGVCGLLPKTLALLITKICDFPYPLYNQIKNLTTYLQPLPLTQLP